MRYILTIMVLLCFSSSCRSGSTRNTEIGSDTSNPTTQLKLVWSNENAAIDEIYNVGFVNLNTDNPYNNRIFAVGALNTFRLFAIDNGQGTIDLSGLTTGTIYKASFNPDGQSFYNGCMDGRIYVRSTATKVPIRIIEAHIGGQNQPGGILTTANNDDFTVVVSGGLDGSLKTWNYNTGLLVKDFGVIHNGGVLDISYDKSNNYIATAGADGAVKIFQPATGTEIISGAVHQGRANAVRFIDSDPDILATAGQDARVRLLRIRDFTQIKEFAFHTSEVKDLEFVPARNLLISCSSDRKIHFYSLENNSLVLSIEAHNGPVYSIALSQDNNYLVSAGSDKRLKLWDVRGINGN